MPHCHRTERSSHPQLSSKRSKNSWLYLTSGSARAPALPGDPAGQRQYFHVVERKGHLLSAHVYLPISEWSCEDYHIPMQSARYKLDNLQEEYFK